MPPHNHGDLIEQLGGASVVAGALSQLPVTIRAWKMRSRIPPEHWPSIIQLAADKAVEVDADWLMRTTPPRKVAA